MNLIKNAIKFTENGKIEMGNYLENGNVWFYVSDTGIGIPEDKVEVIFERFVSVDNTLTRGYEGSGVGLSIVKAYVEALNGSITVESEPGKGSTFLFSIPYKPVEAELENSDVNAELTLPTRKSIVLIAEDDEVNFCLLKKWLVNTHRILHAVNGAEAVQLFKDNPEISLILMDIKMPGEYDGLEATRKIRALNQHVPIIAQTAYAMEADKHNALKAGCNDVITKPFNANRLLALIQKYCNVKLEN
jgi:CheY-like chemotaxis protein